MIFEIPIALCVKRTSSKAACFAPTRVDLELEVVCSTGRGICTSADHTQLQVYTGRGRNTTHRWFQCVCLWSLNLTKKKLLFLRIRRIRNHKQIHWNQRCVVFRRVRSAHSLRFRGKQISLHTRDAKSWEHSVSQISSGSCGSDRKILDRKINRKNFLGDSIAQLVDPIGQWWYC